MSKVTNLIIILPLSGRGEHVNLLDWFAKHERNPPRLVSGRTTTGGDKVFESDIFMGAYNYLEEEFIKALGEFLESLQPADRTGYRHDIDFEQIQLLVKRDNDPMFADWLKQQLVWSEAKVGFTYAGRLAPVGAKP